jgi:hypothetical protein
MKKERIREQLKKEGRNVLDFPRGPKGYAYGFYATF